MELKVPVLISLVGEKAYELMVNLCSPTKPKDKVYKDLVKTMESAERDALTVEEGAVVSTRGRRGALGSGDRHDLDDVHYLSNATNRMRLSECSACGDSRHRWQECRYKSFECSKCRKRGHLRRMCPESLGSEPVNSGAGGAWKRGRNKVSRGGAYRRGGDTRNCSGSEAHHMYHEEENRMQNIRMTEIEAEAGTCEDEEPVYQMGLRDYKPI
ncbi:unnamed protein product, partial [Iphiclides podalirius]